MTSLTTAQLAALRAELTTDPAGLGYAPLLAAGSDSGLAALLNRPPSSFSPPATWTAARPYVPIYDVLIWAAGGPLAALDAGATGPTPAVASLCRAAMALFALPSITTFNPAGSAESAMLAALASASVLTSAQADALVALTSVPATRAQAVLGAGAVASHADVAAAFGRYA